MDKLEEQVSNLSRIVEGLTIMQKNTMTNVNSLTVDIKELTKDIRTTMCSKSNCEIIHSKIKELENRKSCPIGSHIEMLKDIERRLGNIENVRSWLIKIVIGSVIMAVISLVLVKG